MKPLLSGLMIFLGSLVTHAQETTLTGHFAAYGQNSSDAIFYTNTLQVIVSGNAATATINVKAGPKSEPDDYFTCAGTLKGTLEAGTLKLTGTLHLALMDASTLGNHFQENDAPGELAGTLSGNVYTGNLYVTMNGARQTNMTFTLQAGEIVPALTFPLGKSPKVFDKGWLFGAEFKITDNEGKETDLSDKIEWSGTATFEPATGASSRPAFQSVGANKIILTVNYEGKKYSKEYPVITVDAQKYARVGSVAKCMADAHGGPADPLPVIGTVMTGNGNVLINGLPAACEGDRGRHVSCAGPNNFVIVGGDDEVLINGKRAACMAFSETKHCGGRGQLVSLDGYFTSGFTALSGDVTFTDKSGNKIAAGKNPPAGTTMVTGPRGLVVMSPDKNSVLMILPNTEILITDKEGNNLLLEMQNGSIMVNGEKAEGNRNLVIESVNEKLFRKGTRFLYTVNKEQTRLIVYEGEVQLLRKKTGDTITVTAGKEYRNDLQNSYTLSDTASFASTDVLKTLPKDSASWQLPATATAKENSTGTRTDVLTRLKKYWYVIAAVVLVLMALLLRGRKK
ncbi:MAG: PAAR domain-containing protein [Chitinophagaceae bacterium]